MKDPAKHVLPAEMAFLSAIHEKMGQLTPAQQLLAQYLIHNPESIPNYSLSSPKEVGEIIKKWMNPV